MRYKNPSEAAMRIFLLCAMFAAGCECAASGAACASSNDCTRGQMCIRGACYDEGQDAGRVVQPDSSVIPGFDGGSCATASAAVAPLPVDVIIVVDQSASTGEERDAISQNINTNLVEILEASGLDYRVILINSDPALCPPGLANPADCLASNPPRYYRVPQAVNNSDELTLILWTYGGEGRRPNSCVRVANAALGWRDHLRYDALKVFVVFSDDDPESYSASGGQPACGGTTDAFCDPAPAGCPNRDCAAIDWGSECPNFNCPTYADRPADWAGGRDFPTELYALEPAGMFGTPAAPRWIFHSLVGLDRTREPDEPLSGLCDLCDQDGNTAVAAGITYQKLSILTGGLRFPSCNTDYSPVFTRIASTIVPLACELVIEPTAVGGAIDPMLTNVVFTPGDGRPPERLLLDSRPCDVADGWQWNTDFTRIRLCGAACDRVESDPAGEVSITVGCATECQPTDEFCD
jgi:hypothetical protein